MRRALEERPRVMVAKLLAVIAIAATGGLVALALDDDETRVPPATARALGLAERSARTLSAELRDARGEARRARARAGRVGRRAAELSKRQRQLALALRRARRRLTQAP